MAADGGDDVSAPVDGEVWLTAVRAARVLGVRSQQTVRNWAKAGHLERKLDGDVWLFRVDAAARAKAEGVRRRQSTSAEASSDVPVQAFRGLDVNALMAESHEREIRARVAEALLEEYRQRWAEW